MIAQPTTDRLAYEARLTIGVLVGLALCVVGCAVIVPAVLVGRVFGAKL